MTELSPKIFQEKILISSYKEAKQPLPVAIVFQESSALQKIQGKMNAIKVITRTKKEQVEEETAWLRASALSGEKKKRTGVLFIQHAYGKGTQSTKWKGHVFVAKA